MLLRILAFAAIIILFLLQSKSRLEYVYSHMPSTIGGIIILMLLPIIIPVGYTQIMKLKGYRKSTTRK